MNTYSPNKKAGRKAELQASIEVIHIPLEELELELIIVIQKAELLHSLPETAGPVQSWTSKMNVFQLKRDHRRVSFIRLGSRSGFGRCAGLSVTQNR